MGLEHCNAILGSDGNKGHHSHFPLGLSQTTRMSSLVSDQLMGVFQRRLLCTGADETAQTRLLTSMTTVENSQRTRTRMRERMLSDSHLVHVRPRGANDEQLYDANGECVNRYMGRNRECVHYDERMPATRSIRPSHGRGAVRFCLRRTGDSFSPERSRAASAQRRLKSFVWDRVSSFVQ